MSDQKNQTQNLTPRSQKKPGFWKTLFAKRWTFPAIYLGAAALIIGIVVAQTMNGTPKQPEATPPSGTMTNTDNQEAQTTNTAPQWIWPMAADGQEATVTMKFYDQTKDEKTQAKSIIQYDNNFFTQNGVVIGRKDDKAFTVTAAASGTVSRVEADPLMGYVVVIQHDNGYESYYASLSDVEVKEGDKVVQSQPIAKSGNNRFEADQKNHLHFEVKKDGKQIDPESVLPKRGE